jgi:RES domain-containing protein
VGGRWNPAKSFAVLYLGLAEQTVVAEFHRLASQQGLQPDAFLPRTLYRFRARLSRLLDVRPIPARDTLGLSEVASADDLRISQAIGAAAFVAGREGILAPSATGVGEVLAVFLERLQPGSELEEIDSELWEQVPPPATEQDAP